MKTEGGIRVKKLFWWEKCANHGFKILKGIDEWDISLEVLLLNKNIFRLILFWFFWFFVFLSKMKYLCVHVLLNYS